MINNKKIKIFIIYYFMTINPTYNLTKLLFTMIRALTE